ncbi:E3 ubiquitin-protein ligase FANCL-like [Rhopilema esculentum]|uniref:E3 ubiquitin-protein ligase FANCL-like n=1 Tax=Rhopilema esculentum TaxID=499914 RepID=UPI0031D7EEAE
MDSINKGWILIPQNLEKTLLKGILFAKSQEFEIEVKLSTVSDIKDASFNCDWELKNLLNGFEDSLKQSLHNSKDLDEFMHEVHSLTSKLVKIRDRRSQRHFSTSEPGHFSTVIKEIEELGWEKLLHLDASFSSMTLIAKDVASREHLLNVQYHTQDGARTLLCQTDLPAPFRPIIKAKDGGICYVHQQFVQELEKHQDFWDIIGEFDENCWVLEPETQSWSCCFRRVALGSKASLLVTIAPSQPRSLPVCRFLGPDQVVGPLRSKWNHDIALWDVEKTVLCNIKDILEIDLPAPLDKKTEDFSMHCSICYAYRLNDEVPEVACDDSRCGQLFHSACLIEWFRSLPNFRQSFNVMFGECPYCSTPMTVKMSKKSK